MTYRVCRTIERPPVGAIEPLRAARAATIGRWLGSAGCMDRAIQALKKPWRLVGPAVTVQLDDPSVLMPQVAIELAEPGDVLVIAAGGRCETPSWGGGMAVRSAVRGLAGVVVDGVVGGAEPILSRDWPVFSRGTTPRFELPDRPGSVNVPVVCGGVAVMPGDVIVGNSDGVVVVPQRRLSEIAERLASLDADLERWGIHAGASSMLEGAGLQRVLQQFPIDWQA